MKTSLSLLFTNLQQLHIKSTTYKIMHEKIVQISVRGKPRSDSTNMKSFTTISAIKHAIKSAIAANGTLKLLRIKCSIATLFVHVSSKCSFRRSTKTVEVLSTLSVDVDTDPVLAFEMTRVGVCDEHVFHGSRYG